MLVVRRGFFLGMTIMIGATLLGGAGVAQAGADAVRAGGTWHMAIEVPGTATRASASIESVSCPSPGNCAAGGYFVDRSRHWQALVVTEKVGKWGRAIEVPGTAALNTGGLAQVESVSCPSPGNCAANGEFSAAHSGMFVVNEVKGRWGRAHALPGGTGIDDLGLPSPNSLFCPSAGNCVTGGSYQTAGGNSQAFVVDETNGRWGQPLRLAGAGLRASDFARVDAVTCTSAGNCAATGVDRPNAFYQLFAVSEKNGKWGEAVVISQSPGLSKVNVGPNINSMSCASPGDCAVGGSYEYLLQQIVYAQPFVISENAGDWGQAMDVPGLTRPKKGGTGGAESVSCAPLDTCTAGGTYPGPSGGQHAFAVTETGGAWGRAVTLSGAAALNGSPTEVVSLSCTAPGVCAAGGAFFGHSGEQAFVVSEVGGHWAKALPVPGLAQLNAGKAATINSMSCSSPSRCTAVGSYTDNSHHSRAFAVSES